MANYRLDSAAKYAKTHEWVRLEGNTAVVGITDAAQDMLSDVVYVELPEVGREVTAGEEVAVVESVKAAEDVLAPISGTVTEVNQALVDNPELVNSAPYEAWFFKLTPTDAAEQELSQLMSPEAYNQFVAESEH